MSLSAIVTNTKTPYRANPLLIRALVPPEHLRSVLRSLLSTGPEIQTVFRASVRQRLLDFPAGAPAPSALFPTPDVVAPACAEYLAVLRCTFSAKLFAAAIPRYAG